MEDHAEFDLNAAIGKWHEDIDRSPHFHAEDQEELEAHLLDSVAKLRAVGLSDQEAFQIATQRLGTVKAMEPEFAKEKGRADWRKSLPKLRVSFLLLNLVASAWIPPDGDPIRMLCMAAPLQVLFEFTVWILNNWRNKEKLVNHLIHGLIVAFFTLGCWFLWGMLTLVQKSSARILQGEGLALFSQLCIEARPIFWVLPLLAVGYCLYVWIGRTDARRSWVGFFATTMAALVLLSFPTMLATWLPMIAFMGRMATK